jgi:hypothetical protein
MKTLGWFMERCREDCDCMLWTQSQDGGGRPKLTVRRDDTRSTQTVQPRREVWKLVNGEIPQGRYVTAKCGNRLCLNPDHLELITRGEATRRTAKRADTQMRRHIGGLKSRERSERDMSIARYIRSSDKTGAALARELNMPPTTVSAIKLNKRWKETQGNPFAGLM